MKQAKVIDLRPWSGSGMSPSTVQIIEQNTGTQVNSKQMYTELQLANGVPIKVYKYEDDTKARLLFDITINWVNGVPDNIVTWNVDDDITTTTTLGGWTDGVPTQITKVES